jgi:arylsulfatase A-like enzyme
LTQVSTSELAETPDQTQMGRLFAAAMDLWDESGWDLLWIHSQAMQGAWDAPYSWREQFCDEEDPPPPHATQPPAGPLPGDPDPDELQGWLWAYAGQVALLDWCLGPLIERCRTAADPTLLIVMGARGYPLGEHGHWGDSAQVLHTDRLHVPLLMTCPRAMGGAVRDQHLTQPVHVYATLCDWFGIPTPTFLHSKSLLSVLVDEDPGDGSHNDRSSDLPLAYSCLSDYWTLRTPAWNACFSPRDGVADWSASEASRCQLYLKPDDRYDVNNVADRCEPVVRAFRALGGEVMRLSAEADDRCLMPLDPQLLAPPE